MGMNGKERGKRQQSVQICICGSQQHQQHTGAGNKESNMLVPITKKFTDKAHTLNIGNSMFFFQHYFCAGFVEEA